MKMLWSRTLPLYKSAGLFFAPPRGVEPRFQDPESCVLSIKLWGRGYGAAGEMRCQRALELYHEWEFFSGVVMEAWEMHALPVALIFLINREIIGISKLPNLLIGNGFTENAAYI